MPNSFRVEEIKEWIGNFTKLLHYLKILFAKFSIFECVEKTTLYRTYTCFGIKQHCFGSKHL
jgi:hypothetical protein